MKHPDTGLETVPKEIEMSEFEVSTERDGGIGYVRCSGELTVTSASRLREAIDIVVEGAPDQLRLNTEGVTRIGLAGISAIMIAGLTCRASDVDFLFRPGEVVREALDEAGLWWVGVLPDPFVGTRTGG